MKTTRRIVFAAIAAVVITASWLTRADEMSALPQHTANAQAGERWFWLGGCASCHASAEDDKLQLGGGLELDTPFGLFRAPNISTHPDDGIGSWSVLDFVNAMQRGVSPDGKHYYPSFPYSSYSRMRTEDVMDLKAFLDTLPAVAGSVASHELEFPYSVRRGIGLWKRRYLDKTPPAIGLEPLAETGRYLVEGAGHCGECHTPRDAQGGMLMERWLAGAPNMDGPGRVPDITPSGKAVGSWSIDDIASYFESGFTPDYDTVGGSMVAVQENLAQLTDADRKAIAAYLKSLPPADVERDTD